MVDVVKTDDSERREYIERRDGILKKREEDIANLEEELRSIPVGNTRAIANKQKEIEASIEAKYNVPLVKTQMKKIIVTAKTLYSHPKNVSKIYAALHTDLAW